VNVSQTVRHNKTPWGDTPPYRKGKTDMKMTFILKGWSEQFYTGFSDWKGFDNMTDLERLEWCKKQGGLKCGNGSFRDRVECNTIFKDKPLSSTIENRKGYKLLTFIKGKE
jgi:hypothetical protein